MQGFVSIPLPPLQSGTGRVKLGECFRSLAGLILSQYIKQCVNFNRFFNRTWKEMNFTHPHTWNSWVDMWDGWRTHSEMGSHGMEISKGERTCVTVTSQISFSDEIFRRKTTQNGLSWALLQPVFRRYIRYSSYPGLLSH